MNYDSPDNAQFWLTTLETYFAFLWRHTRPHLNIKQERKIGNQNLLNDFEKQQQNYPAL